MTKCFYLVKAGFRRSSDFGGRRDVEEDSLVELADAQDEGLVILPDRFGVLLEVGRFKESGEGVGSPLEKLKVIK